MPSPIKVRRPGEYPRKYIPANADLGEWDALEPLLQELERRKIGSADALRRWLADNSELSACFDEESSRRFIEMTCATDDAERERRYLHVVQQLVPRLKPYANRLEKKYFGSKFRKQLNRREMEVHDREIAVELKLFREKNIPLEQQLELLSQKYQKITGAMTVRFQGKERTLPQMTVFAEATDRRVRKRAWTLVAARRLKDRARLNRIFNQMVELRHQAARNAGYKNYLEYIFPKKKRFDYTPADCVAFHDAVEQCAVPFMRRLDEQRKANLKLRELRPWDLAVDPLGRAPLRPFRKGRELAQKCARIFRELDPQLGAQFRLMLDKSLLDLESRKGKAPGGYQSSLNEVRLPFIFMNAAGTDKDVYTLLHEGGHAFHALAARELELYEYRHGPIEFCEVASMGMELLCCDKLSAFYNRRDAGRSLRQHLEGCLMFFPWCATIDAFQHWIYRHPKHTTRERDHHWLELQRRFGHAVDWSGLEKIHAASWQRQLHLFEVPFYYIEYGIAQLGALQLWMNYRQDPRATLTAYINALVLGGSRPLPELFETAGLKFDFSRATLEPIVAEVEQVLAELPE